MEREPSEEELLVWQDVLDEIAAGRTRGHRCPLCLEGELAVSEEQSTLRVECPKCRRFFEGRRGLGEG